MTQLEIHKRIDEFFASSPQIANIVVVKEILNTNYDAQKYFFSTASKAWLSWIWGNGFLDKIKDKAADIGQYSYRLPELDFLARMSDEDPSVVADIILSTPISEKTFNPEVVDRFLWIIGELPPEQIKRVIAKIRDERWPFLMRNFNRSGYEYQRIVKSLLEAKQFSALLDLAEAILETKSKEESSRDKNGFSREDFFYVREVNDTEIFDALVQIDVYNAEKALEITTNAIGKTFKEREEVTDKVFEFADQYCLYHIDFFKLTFQQNENDVIRRNDVRSLALVIKELIIKLVAKNCADEAVVKRVFHSYVEKLPNAQSMWRLQLFTLAQCPEVFKEELKDAFFRLFKVKERYFEIESGAEYHHALICGFNVLEESIKREYILKVIEYFTDKNQDEDVQKWRKRDGLKILSCIKDQLNDAERARIKSEFEVDINQNDYIPHTDDGEIRGGMVRPRAHVDLKVFSVTQIIQNLKTDWTPQKLKEQFKNDDFLNPRGVEGLGEEIVKDVKERPSEYITNLFSFFDRETIDAHYLYSLLRGFEEMFRGEFEFSETEIASILNLFSKIRDGGIAKPFTPFNNVEEERRLDWIMVHKVVTDILLPILHTKLIKKEHAKYRKQLLDIIGYLLTIADSPSKEEEKPEYGELNFIAINSVRGRAYEAFVQFIYNDGKFIESDVKSIFEKVLNDQSLAVHFVIGQYIASFYYRDKDYLLGLLPRIFPKDNPSLKDIFLATWEGYLMSNLYREIFIDLRSYYEHAILLSPKEYTERKYAKGLDETLAIHIALAFLHLDLKIDDELFQLFWKNPNTVRHHEFISFIGRRAFTSEFAGNQWLEDNNIDKKKLLDFWSWILRNPTIQDSKIFTGFGFWINQQKEILDDKVVAHNIALTLKKSNSDIDWDYGLLNSISRFAKVSPDDTIEIVKNYLFDTEGSLSPQHPIRFSGSSEVKEALRTIYANGNAAQRQKIMDLVNLLLEKGSSVFWDFKKIVE